MEPLRLGGSENDKAESAEGWASFSDLLDNGDESGDASTVTDESVDNNDDDDDDEDSKTMAACESRLGSGGFSRATAHAEATTGT